MRAIFNSKIKILLLILMWTLICRRQCGYAVIAITIAVDGPRLLNAHNDVDVFNPEGLSKQKHNESAAVEQVAKDQLGGINKTLSVPRTHIVALYGLNSSMNDAGVHYPNDDGVNAGIPKKFSFTASKVPKENNRAMRQTTIAEWQHNAKDKVDRDDDNKPTESIDNENSANKDQRVYVDDIVDDNNDGNEVAIDDTADMSTHDMADEPGGTAANIDDHARNIGSPLFLSTHDGSMVVTDSLQNQLIYEFAIKYKQIPRITYFTCRNGDAVNDSERQKTRQRPQQSRLSSFNTRTMKLLRQMNAATATATSTSAATGTAAAPTTPMTKQAHKGNGYTSDGKNNDDDDDDENDDNDAVDDDVNGGLIEKGQHNAEFTIQPEKSPKKFEKHKNSATQTRSAAQASATTAEKNRKSILIKVVQIDQLVGACRHTFNNTKSINSTRCYSTSEHLDARKNKCNIRNDVDKYACIPTNWLEAVLRPNMLRQIIALDLSCGAASRKLIKMASRRGLFSCAYHWLLIEDYAFNGQTENDDDDGNNMKKNNDCNNIDNANNDIKKKSNIKVGITNRKQQRQQTTLRLHPSTTTTMTTRKRKTTIDDDAKLSLNNIRNLVVVGNQQRATHIKFNATVDSIAAPSIHADGTPAFNDAIRDVEDMQIIEKFLEKINININTELILAKRIRFRNRMCDRETIQDNGYNNNNKNSKNQTETRTETETETVTGAEKDGSMPLQKKEYYMLYDVWNPGLYYGGQLNISEIGQFTFDDGLRIASRYRRSNTVARRKNMKLAKIRNIMVITNKNRRDTLEHYLTTHYDTHLDSMNRFSFALLSLVRDLYNFSLITKATSTWGYIKNGKYDGMIGAVIRKQADICGSPIFFYAERAKVIDYTAKTWEARPCFIFRHPRNVKAGRIFFLQPFQQKVWILLLCCGIATVILLWLLKSLEIQVTAVQQFLKPRESGKKRACIREKVAKKNRFEQEGERSDRNEALRRETENPNAGNGVGVTIHSSAKLALKASLGFNNERKRVHEEKIPRERCHARDISGLGRKRQLMQLFDAFIFYVGTMCQQGLTFSTSFISARCIVITSLLFAFAIFQFYSASVVSTLLMERPRTIRTLRDLIRNPLEIGIEDLPYNRDYFRRTKDPEAIELYEKKMINTDIVSNATEKHDAAMQSHLMGVHAKPSAMTNWYTPEEGIAKMKEGKFAFHVDIATAYKIILDSFTEKEICELTEIQLFPKQKTVGCVQKGSPLRKMLTHGLRRVSETGLMNYQTKIWHSPKPQCVRQIHTDDLQVDMETITSALKLLLIGHVVSLTVFCCEIAYAKLWQRFTGRVVHRPL